MAASSDMKSAAIAISAFYRMFTSSISFIAVITSRVLSKQDRYLSIIFLIINYWLLLQY